MRVPCARFRKGRDSQVGRNAIMTGYPMTPRMKGLCAATLFSLLAWIALFEGGHWVLRHFSGNIDHGMTASTTK